MPKLIHLVATTMLLLPAVFPCAAQEHNSYDGIWAVDMEASSKAILSAGSEETPAVCKALGFTYIPIMLVVEVDGPIAWLGALNMSAEQKIPYRLTEEKSGMRIYKGIASSLREKQLILSLGAEHRLYVTFGKKTGFDGLLWTRRDAAWVISEGGNLEVAVEERSKIISKMCK